MTRPRLFFIISNVWFEVIDLVLDLDAVKRKRGAPVAFHIEQDGLLQSSPDPSIQWGKIVVDGSCSAEQEDVYVLSGALHVEYQTYCARCLAPVNAALEVDFNEEFARSESEEYPDRYLFDGQTLDVTKMVEDLIALNLPLRHLCSEDCKGICPTCGVDRNKVFCNCSEGINLRENAFAALASKLREENEEV